MRRYRIQSGFTLIELLVVAAIIVVMASALVGVGRRMLTRAQEKLARSTMDVLVTAIEQYHGELDRFPMEYRGRQGMSGQEQIPVMPWNPIDKTGFSQTDLILYLNDDLGLNRTIPAGTLTILPQGVVRDAYAVSECLYYFLYQCPTSRRMIDTIADSQKTAIAPASPPQQPKPSPRQAVYKDVTITLIRLIDPWGSPLRYEYTPGTMSFPRITSAGPDRQFDTTDDLRSDE